MTAIGENPTDTLKDLQLENDRLRKALSGHMLGHGAWILAIALFIGLDLGREGLAWAIVLGITGAVDFRYAWKRRHGRTSAELLG